METRPPASRPCFSLRFSEILCPFLDCRSHSTFLTSRQSIDYLNSEIGYCNRFDRGAVANCYQFWLDPKQNWEQEYQSGQSYMERNRLTTTSNSSPGWIFSFYDWRKRQKALEAKRKEEETFQRIAKGEI